MKTRNRLAFARSDSMGNGMAKPKPHTFDDPTPAELEMIMDAANGKPLKRPAKQGVADMKARIKLLTGQMQRLLRQMELAKNTARQKELNQTYLQLKRELGEAKDRLAEYQLQHKSLN